MLKLSNLVIILSVILIDLTDTKEIFLNNSNPEIEYWERTYATRWEGVGLNRSGNSNKRNNEVDHVRPNT
ncbi:MAG: hypothetical protein ACJA2S_003001 [Cyclobacteriaceae bacterium]|jgi:hypothetical protein